MPTTRNFATPAPIAAVLVSMAVTASCNGRVNPLPSQGQPATAEDQLANVDAPGADASAVDTPDHDLGATRIGAPFANDPVGKEVQNVARRTFQDRRGNLWFGGDGVSRYDGKSLEHFAVAGRFGVSVRAIAEDQAGNIWFATSAGLSKYDGESFSRLAEEDGLRNDDVWSLEIDTRGTIWAGTAAGVSRFDDGVFTRFDLPEAEPDLAAGFPNPRTVRSIMEDSRGRMWFGTNGGAYIYDGESLTHLSEREGLCNNSVNAILEDAKGRYWFATHHNGVCRLEGASFTHVTEDDGVVGTEAWDVYEDRSGNVWFPIENSGLYRYDGESFANFHTDQGLELGAVQSVYEDTDGRVWAGGAGGLYRYDGKRFTHVTRAGPWD